MTRYPVKSLLLLLLSTTLLIGLPAQGQEQPPPLNVSAVQFNLSNPGARSLGLGGAFLGLADDATAAYANPAGLTILNRPEVSAEVRNWEFTNEYVEGGHGFFDAAGNPTTGQPTGFGFDTATSLLDGESTDDNTGLSFLSFVYPGDRWAVAVYTHQLAAFESSRQTTGAYIDFGDTLFRFYPVRSFTELDIINYGVSGALRLSDRVSVGVGVNYVDFDLAGVTRSYSWSRLETPNLDAPGEPFGPPDYSDANVRTLERQEGADEDVTFLAGLLWQLSDRWSLGAVYRQGAEFEFVNRGIVGPVFLDAGDVFFEDDQSFQVPDSYGVGLAYRPTDALVVAFDWNRVEYSKVLDGVDQGQVPDGRLVVDDADELHLGVEYVFLDLANPLALRFGVWNDPDHRIRYDGTSPFLGIDFPEGDDEVHYTAGLGLVLGESFQLDAAADVSDLVTTLSLSGVYRF